MRVFCRGPFLAELPPKATADRIWQVDVNYSTRRHITAYVGWLSTKKMGSRSKLASQKLAASIPNLYILQVHASIIQNSYLALAWTD